MATAVKNGRGKKETATANTQLKEKLAQQAVGASPKTLPTPVEQPKEPVITLDDRIAKFKKLQGLN